MFDEPDGCKGGDQVPAQAAGSRAVVDDYPRVEGSFAAWSVTPFVGAAMMKQGSATEDEQHPNNSRSSLKDLADGPAVHTNPVSPGRDKSNQDGADSDTSNTSGDLSIPMSPCLTQGQLRSPRPAPDVQKMAKQLQKYADISLMWETAKGEDDDDDGDALEVQAPRKWYRTSTFNTWVVLVMLSGALITVGVILHQVSDVADDLDIQPFRWLYFFGAWPTLWVVSRLITWQCFSLAEWYFYREALYFWRSVQHTGSLLLFFIVALVWYNAVYNWAWCDGHRCEDPQYEKAKTILWRLVLCLGLFSLANFIKSVVAKVMSSHFYSTTHFKTVKRELEKEYYLVALSRPRDELIAQEDTSKAFPFPSRSRQFYPGPTGLQLGGEQGKEPQGQHGQQVTRQLTKKESIAREARIGKLDMYVHWAEAADGFTPNHGATGQVMESRVPAAAQQLSKAMSTNRRVSETPGCHAEPCLEVVLQGGDVERGTGLASGERTAKRSLNGADGQAVSGKSDGRPGPRDPTTEAQMFHRMADPRDLHRLRTVMAIKTVTALVKRYHSTSNQEEEKRIMKHARKFAKGLFWNIKGPALRDHLLLEDFDRFFDGDKHKAKEAYACFDKDSNGQISLEETIQSVQRITQERRNVAASLSDTDCIVSSLERAIGLVVHFIFFLVYLPIWGVGILEGFNALSASVLALTFIFGDSLRNAYENSVYLFVEHPYDVGDMIWVDNAYWRVKKIDLLYTVLLKGSGECVYYPNRRLRENTLMNLTKSNDQWDSVQLLIDTTQAQPDLLMKLDQAMKTHIAKFPGDYGADKGAVAHFRNIEDPVKMRVALSWPYCFASDQLMRVFKTRSNMLAAITEVLNAEGVSYTLPYKDLSWQQTTARWEPAPDGLTKK